MAKALICPGRPNVRLAGLCIFLAWGLCQLNASGRLLKKWSLAAVVKWLRRDPYGSAILFLLIVDFDGMPRSLVRGDGAEEDRAKIPELRRADAVDSRKGV